ncbi:DMT family transporter [Shewanella intestini]|uniref:DMT family transporter n=1 Tax=Shewanella intestini TaxID=2017544 RepID=A0ABS5I2A0_9GAMM|nr:MULTISPECIES: DMT family transporter [Shewanella]MBR9728132.1 DMT family transporter [Shewanella intestini]MRG36603.1 EamA family transporter [Shewanella sp. XMDDZSB0408]
MKPAVLLGVGLLIVGNVFSALYDVSVKWLPDNADAASFLLIRQCLSVLMVLPFWLTTKKAPTQHLTLHFFRSNIGAIGGMCFIIGLMSLPLATASSLFFAGPILIVIMGAFFLKEQVSIVQWLTIFLGFVGILILLKPTQINWYGVIVLVSAFSFAINQLTIKKLPTTESPTSTLIYYNLLSIPLVVIIAVAFGGVSVSWHMVGIAVLSNSFLLIYQWFCVKAYRQAQASDIAIAEYTGLLFCVFFGWLWFDEWLDALSWFGAALIVLPSLILPWAMIKWQKSRVNKIILQQPKVSIE